MGVDISHCVLLLAHSKVCPIPAVPWMAALSADITAEMKLNCAMNIRVPLSLKLRGDTTYHACFPALVILSIGFSSGPCPGCRFFSSELTFRFSCVFIQNLKVLYHFVYAFPHAFIRPFICLLWKIYCALTVCTDVKLKNQRESKWSMVSVHLRCEERGRSWFPWDVLMTAVQECAGKRVWLCRGLWQGDCGSVYSREEEGCVQRAFLWRLCLGCTKSPQQFTVA